MICSLLKLKILSSPENPVSKEIKAFWERNANEASSQGSKLHRDIEFFYNGEWVNKSVINSQFYL